MYTFTQLAKDINAISGTSIDYRKAKAMSDWLNCDVKTLETTEQYELLVNLLTEPGGVWKVVNDCLRGRNYLKTKQLEALKQEIMVSVNTIDNLIGELQ